jgi:hypothetical protein
MSINYWDGKSDSNSLELINEKPGFRVLIELAVTQGIITSNI